MTYGDKVIRTTAQGIRAYRMLSATMAARFYRENGYLPSAVTKKQLIESAEKQAAKMISRDLEEGTITKRQATYARKKVSAWLASLWEAPDMLAEKERDYAMRQVGEKPGKETGQ